MISFVHLVITSNTVRLSVCLSVCLYIVFQFGKNAVYIVKTIEKSVNALLKEYYYF